MLADIIMEEEFQGKESGPWYDKRDLEHDLLLAAELGKTLLERNHDLEEGLRHMYSTNEDQQQEMEYLAKQVELMRQVNEQHAKLYEQLDEAAQGLELSNQKLQQDKQRAQHRLHRLTDTIDGLQIHVQELQKQVEQLQVSPSDCSNSAQVENKRLAQSVCCLKQLYHTHMHRWGVSDNHVDYDAWLSAETSLSKENSRLERSMRELQTQLGAEQARREEAEREAESVAQENAKLELQVTDLEARCSQERVLKLEVELEESRQLWRAEVGGARMGSAAVEDALPSPLEERVEPPEDGGEEVEAGLIENEFLAKGVLRGSSAEEILRGHDLSCIRRAQAVKRRGVSLLSEVDAQYSALQAQYDQLLHQSQPGGDGRSHKAVQTRDRIHSAAATPTQLLRPEEDSQPPEYRALFQEIFTCIQKSRQDLSQPQ